MVAKVTLRLQLQGGAPDKLLQLPVGRIFLQLQGVDLLAPAGAGDIAAIDSRADGGGSSVPIEFLDVGSLRLISAAGRIGKGIVDPAFPEAAQDTVPFSVIVVAKGVDQQSSKCQSFPGRIRRKDQASSLIADRRIFGHKDIDWTASPSLVFVEGAVGLIKTHFVNELIGALNERLDVRWRAQGAGTDGVVGA